MLIKKFKKNQNGRDFVVGDIHGEYTKLTEQLGEISFDYNTDRLFAVGDIIDRGSHSVECLNLIFEPWFYSVRGNHEELMLDSILHRCKPSMNCWINNGGEWYFDLYDKEDKTQFDEITETVFSIQDLNLLTVAIEIESTSKHGKVGIVHAQPPLIWSEENIRDQRLNLLWGRSFLERAVTVEGVDNVFVGHTPMVKGNTPVNYGGNITYTDSGAVFVQGRKLCIVEL